MGGATGERLAEALAAQDVWGALSELLEAPSADLAAVVEEQYPLVPAEDRRRLSWLLRGLREQGDEVLLRLLERATGDDAYDLLREAVGRGLRVPVAVLRRLADELGTVPPVVDAMGLSGDAGFADGLGALLDHRQLGGPAALALGRLGARRWTGPIGARVPDRKGLEHVAFVVALELMDDPAAVPHLLWALHRYGGPMGDVHHALVRLTGRDPLVRPWGAVAEFDDAVREAWERVEAAGAEVGKAWERGEAAGPAWQGGAVGPEVRELVVESATRAGFVVDEGRARIRVDYDPPLPGSAWHRWNRSLLVDGQPLYRVSSHCGTCETTLGLLGWPAERPLAGAAGLRAALAEVEHLADGVLDAAVPLLRELETGHYRAYLLDVPVERVAEPGRSWWVRRWEDREGAELHGSPDSEDWPGTGHFQLPERIPGEMPTYGVLLPSQPLDGPGGLDERTVASYAEAVAAGRRPAAVVLGWVEERWVEAEHQERFLVGMVLDGHHRLAAYAAAGVPARVVLIARLEDNRGDDGTWGGPLDEVVGRL